MRALLLLALIAVVVIVLRRLPAGWRPRLPSTGPRRRDELVKDPVCQTYIVMSRAIRSEAGGAPMFFCSRECAARFQRGERRA
jgi:YHS domain-containing protein